MAFIRPATAVVALVVLVGGCGRSQSALSAWKQTHQSQVAQYKADIERVQKALATISVDGNQPILVRASDGSALNQACFVVSYDSSVARSWHMPLTQAGTDAQLRLSKAASAGTTLFLACQKYASSPTASNFDTVSGDEALLQGDFYAWYRLLT